MKKLLTMLSGIALLGTSNAQGFYDENTIQTIEITFAQSNWDALLDAEKAGNEDYIMAQSVTINGTVFDSVGVKYKGNSTYNANQTKNPFHIELDTYKDHIYEDYTDIKLSNVANDPSFVREVLSYKILRNYMFAPKSNYANVYVNGDLIGLYSNSEAISKKFVKSRFDSKKNTFVKCNPPAGAGPGSNDYPSLEYISSDSADYYDSYELKSDFGWDELIDLTDTLKNNLSDIEDILDVDRALWMLAFDNVLVNLDSYIGEFKQNYYLYRDDEGKFNSIVWDLNESFGRFSMTGSGNLNSTTAKSQMSHLLHENDTDYPLMQQLMSVPMYKRMYLAHVKTMLLEQFDSGNYYVEGQALQATIDAAVQADPNKFYTYANFTSNLTNDISSGGPGGGSSAPGIKNLMDARASYLLGLSDFTATQPTITNVAESSSIIELNDTFTITADITDENTVYLGYRTDEYGHFTRVLMYDDGAHNDGAAGDGKYGVDVTMTDLYMQYYIYAENNDIGKFSPVRAEHEYYTITASGPTIGDLVINEFMASNSTTQPDQNGEFDDWIELYNNGSSTIDLSNYYLSDDAADMLLWQFPVGATIAAGDYFVLWADDDLTQTGAHANFKLSSGGETLFLSDGSGTVIDQVTYDAQTTDISYGRYPNGTGSFIEMLPTYNAENTNSTSSIVMVDEFQEVVAYPNPVTDILNIQMENGVETQTANIFDVSGKLMTSQVFQGSTTMNLSEFAKGIYFMKVANTTLKIVKQ